MANNMSAMTLDTSSVSPTNTTTATSQVPQSHNSATIPKPTPSNPPAQPPVNPPAQESQPPQPHRSASPQRPPVSPITPPLNPASLPPVPQTKASQLPPPSQATPQQPNFAANRPAFTHPPIPDASATAIVPQAPEPIDFDSNPDVLALKSAISILQLQRQRAANDIRGLNSAKSAALEDPDAFIADLTSGRIRGQGDPLFPSGDQDSSSDEDDDNDEDSKEGVSQILGPSGNGADTSSSATKPASKGKSKSRPPKKPWSDLPRPQNVVRCPPINWSQYAVAGDSLDRLHAEQVARPSQGQPAVMGQGGSFEFRAGGSENPKEFVGVAAPYTPGRDKVDKKTKGKR